MLGLVRWPGKVLLELIGGDFVDSINGIYRKHEYQVHLIPAHGVGVPPDREWNLLGWISTREGIAQLCTS